MCELGNFDRFPLVQARIPFAQGLAEVDELLFITKCQYIVFFSHVWCSSYLAL